MPIELQISVKNPDHWRSEGVSALHDKINAAIASKIRARDQETCQSCHLSLPKFMEVHHLNDDHTDYDEKNLITVCPLCHAIPHIGLCAEKQRGWLIYMPELPQHVVTRLAIWAYLWPASSLCDFSNFNRANMDQQTDLIRKYYTASTSTLAAFFEHRKHQANAIVSNASLGSVAEMVLKAQSNPAICEQLEARLKPLRLIPNFDAYPKELRAEIASAQHEKIPGMNAAKSQASIL